MTTLSEWQSKARLRSFGVPFPPEHRVADAEAAVGAADELGYPVVVKLGGDAIAHKTERGLVRLGLDSAAVVRRAASDLLAAARPEDGPVHLLVGRVVHGRRELIAGLHQDPTFGMTVMVGMGGILAEATADVAFRLVPIAERDALEMIDELQGRRVLDAVRGEPPADRGALAELLLALSHAAEADPALVSADLNPIIISGSQPFAVDALVELAEEIR